MRYLLTALCLMPTLVLAQELHTFKNGEVADADELNRSLALLIEKIEALEARVAALEPDPNPLAGTWRVKSEERSLQVGPAPGDGSWWAIDNAGVVTRACYFDDDYVFHRDGTFENVLGDETWLWTWQGVPTDQCGVPVPPHDGTADATWSYDEDAGALVIEGFGAYIGLPGAVNEGELPNVAVPTSITYKVAFADGGDAVVTIEAGPGVWWTYRLVKTRNAGAAP